MSHRDPRLALAICLLFLLPALAAAQFFGGPSGPQKAITVPPLQFHYMGPAAAGRISAAAGVPGDPTTYYLGSASGGLWKSTDGGHSFLPIFDRQDAAAIGTIAVAPSDASTVWVGTGEPWVIRPSDIIGDGVYRSTDAGATWHNMGLAATGRIARIVINPQDADNVLVCAEGRLGAPQHERGVFRTTDGGLTWKQTLFVDENTGCSGLAMDPSNPNSLLAGTWQVEQRTWVEASGGPGSGVWASRDNGQTWTRLTAGLPHSPVGKVDVAIAPLNGKRAYALMQTADQGSLWRSDDGGANWKVVSWDRSLIGRAGYYIRLAVNPQNADDVLITSSSFHRSLDGGLTFAGNGGKARTAGAASCGDCHDIWMDPKDPARYMLTDDGGASIATGAGTALQVSLPNGQMYHVATDNRVPYWIYSNRQDDGTMRGPSTVSLPSGNGLLPKTEFMPRGSEFDGFDFSDFFGGGEKPNPELVAKLPQAAPAPPGFAFGPNDLTKAPSGGFDFSDFLPPAPKWQPDIGGCESGFTIPDPTDANVVWATCYGNKLTRYDAREGEAHSVEPSEISLDSPPNQVKYRCHWTAPLAIDPFDHNNVYYGCQVILKTSDKGNSWAPVSPDLSTHDPSRVVSNGGIVGDNLGQYDGEVVWAMAPSPVQRGLLWAGTNDGKLWYTKDGESASPHWVDVSANLHLPPWGEFNQITPSSFDPATAYVAVDFRMAGAGDLKPYLLKTTDFGATWRSVVGDLPASNPLDYTLSITENPNRKGMLFAGTAHAFYYSLDDGAHWTHFSAGLPPAPVSWITVEKRFHDVVISTYGRGLYILPDITLLEQTGATVPAGSATRLLAPGAIFRTARGVYPTAADPARPPFQFELADTPETPVTMEILDAAGREIRTQKINAHQGLNGAYWDLLYDAPTLVELRTTPPENPHIWDEPRFQGKQFRTITHWGITPTTGVPLAAPSAYQVRLTVDGKSYTEPFTVQKDPAIEASDADLAASTAMQVRIRGDITATSEMVNQMEKWRKATTDAALNQKILAVELQLVTRSEMLSDDKYFPEAYKVYMNLIWLSGGVGQGASDEAGGVDYAPTATQVQVLDEIEKQLAQAKSAYAQLQATIPH
ncbi:MAG TPA: hypothetical protein VN709_12600 [Terriglobales bacterium]|nr:hypothetical protein [Terriglobales bacterium]